MGRDHSIRLGMIGAGKMALWHLRAYHRLPGVKVVAIANPSSPRGVALQRRFRIAERYASGQALIERASVDAVDICIPTAQHVAHVAAALQRGLHVYCEKPLATTPAEYAALADAERASGRVLFNGFNYRFMPEFEETAAVLRGGRLGAVRYVRFFRATREEPDSYMLGREHTGVLQEFQCHFVDLLEAFGLPKPVRVRATGTTVLPWTLSPDTVTTQLVYADGALAEITTCSATPGMAASLLVVGTEGTLTVRAGRVRVTPPRDRWPLPMRVLHLVRESMTCPHRVLRNPFVGSCRHFIRCVRGERQNGQGAEAAGRVHAVLAEAERAL
ncbi:MAG: Gfo/Idh/MocA family oxidoreductase [Lentisphaerae bacterium]|nr:Gfo/Idh/MocA family oxidoreductase [Lentisphaerota bacterium]